MFELVVLLRDRVIGRSSFDAPLVRVGRSPDNDVVIDNPVFSRCHALIRRHGLLYTVEDLKTPNGTYVNGRRIASWTLSDGDRIVVGKFTLVFGSKLALPDVTRAAVEGARTLVAPTRGASPEQLERSARVRGELACRLPSGEERSFAIAKDAFLVGKDPECDVVTGGWFAPARLVLIARGQGAFTLVNVSGSGRVRLNGRPVAWQAWLEDGDTLVLGSVFASFHRGLGDAIGVGSARTTTSAVPVGAVG